jgi:hypothetical protein
MLIFSANSANGGLQSASVTGPEYRQRRVWVVLRPSTIKPLAFRLEGRRSAYSVENTRYAEFGRKVDRSERPNFDDRHSADGQKTPKNALPNVVEEFFNRIGQNRTSEAIPFMGRSQIGHR